MRDKEKNRINQRDFRSRMTKEEKKLFDQKRYQKYKNKFYERSSLWAKNNPHKSQASTHQTQVKNNYPETFKESDIETKALAEWVLVNRGKPCPYCGDEATHIDHIIPLAKNGPHTWENIEMVCKRCNMAKSDGTKEDFLTWINKLRHSTELNQTAVV